MNVTQTTYVLGYAGAALLIFGLAIAIGAMVLDPTSFVRRQWAKHEAAIDREVRFQLWTDTSGAKIARIQLAVMIGLFVLSIVMAEPLLVAIIPIVGIAPTLYLQNKHTERVGKIEDLLDAWLLLVANALRASPSLGEAIANSAKLIRPPFSQEIDLVIKENKLGSPLDDALLSMGRRLNSRIISSSLATILVGRTTGGDLPAILEQSASTLREMARLEGVVRAKTAEGKAQAVVLAATPFILVGIIYWMDPVYMNPLFETAVGNIVLALAIGLWFTAIILMRRILSVDI